MLEWDSEDGLIVNLTNPGLVRVDPASLERLDEPMQSAVSEGGAHPAEQVIGILRAADARLGDAMEADPQWRMHARPHRAATGTATEVRDLFERLHSRAGFLDEQARKMVRHAHRIAGFESVRATQVVEAVLRATREITEAHALSVTAD
jgi:hypothetical protein